MAHFLIKSILFPAPYPEPALPMSVGPTQKVRNMQDLSILRVSVLDLDNSVRFSRDTLHKDRGNNLYHAFPEGNQLRSSAYLR